MQVICAHRTGSCESNCLQPPEPQYNIQEELIWGLNYRQFKENEKNFPIPPKKSPLNIPFQVCRAEVLAEQLGKPKRKKGRKSGARDTGTQRKITLLERSIMSQPKYMDILSKPNPNYITPPEKKPKRRCVLEPCPPRFVQLAVPNKRRVFANWKDYQFFLPAEMLLRYEEILHTDLSLEPRQARNYYKQLDRKRKKERKRKMMLKKKKQRERERGEKAWMRQEIDQTAKVIVDYIRDEPLFALTYKQLMLSDGILERLEKTKVLKKKIKRTTRNHFKKTIVEISDKCAVWLDTLTRFVDVQAVESDEDLPPLSISSLSEEEEGEWESSEGEEEEEEYGSAEGESEEYMGEEEEGEEEEGLSDFMDQIIDGVTTDGLGEFDDDADAPSMRDGAHREGADADLAVGFQDDADGIDDQFGAGGAAGGADGGAAGGSAGGAAGDAAGDAAAAEMAALLEGDGIGGGEGATDTGLDDAALFAEALDVTDMGEGTAEEYEDEEGEIEVEVLMEPEELDGRIIKGHKPSVTLEHAPDGVCCLSLKIWAVWLLEITHNAHNWTKWISDVIHQIKEFASTVRGDVKNPDGTPKQLKKSDWRQFCEDTEQGIIAWRQYAAHVRDLSASIIENFHGKRVFCCPACLKDHYIRNVCTAHETLQALTEAISCAEYWQRTLDELVEKTAALVLGRKDDAEGSEGESDESSTESVREITECDRICTRRRDDGTSSDSGESSVFEIEELDLD